MLKTRKGWKTSTLLYFRWFEFTNVKLVISYEKNWQFRNGLSRFFLDPSLFVCDFFACNTAIIFPAQAWTWYSKYHCTTALTEFRIKIMFGISINGHPQSFFHRHKVFIPPTLCYAFCKSFEIGEKLSSPQVKRVSTWITLTSTTEVIIGSNRTD